MQAETSLRASYVSASVLGEEAAHCADRRAAEEADRRAHEEAAHWAEWRAAEAEADRRAWLQRISRETQGAREADWTEWLTEWRNVLGVQKRSREGRQREAHRASAPAARGSTTPYRSSAPKVRVRVRDLGLGLGIPNPNPNPALTLTLTLNLNLILTLNLTLALTSGRPEESVDLTSDGDENSAQSSLTPLLARGPRVRIRTPSRRTRRRSPSSVVVGERTFAQRDAELRGRAIDLEAETPRKRGRVAAIDND